MIPTRSFGDFLLKSEQDKPPRKQVISAAPQLQTFHLNCQWEFLVVGCGSIWDAMSNVDNVPYPVGAHNYELPLTVQMKGL